MRKMTTVLVSFIILTYGLSTCSKEQNNQDGIQKTAPSDNQVFTVTNPDSIFVTFIELGSVSCIPCKMMMPVMEEIEEEYSDQVKVVFHDVWTEEGKPYAQKYGISAIPTQIFLDREGKEYFRHTGFFPKEDLVKVLKQQGVQ